MATFITIGYGDQAGYDRTAPSVRDEAHAHDERLSRGGARIGRAGNPVQVRNPEGSGVQRQDGAFMSAELPLAGFMLIEADSLDQAVAMVADTPCAVAHGVVEVWPLSGS
ncbi:YciI family protein [Agromyces mediolanus]|uniref:YciI family protein n=1 Tax=Agromyces mediolanus TaxID=41986 RepID=UPI00383593D2